MYDSENFIQIENRTKRMADGKVDDEAEGAQQQRLSTASGNVQVRLSAAVQGRISASRRVSSRWFARPGTRQLSFLAAGTGLVAWPPVLKYQ